MNVSKKDLDDLIQRAYQRQTYLNEPTPQQYKAAMNLFQQAAAPLGQPTGTDLANLALLATSTAGGGRITTGLGKPVLMGWGNPYAVADYNPNEGLSTLDNSLDGSIGDPLMLEAKELIAAGGPIDTMQELQNVVLANTPSTPSPLSAKPHPPGAAGG